MNLVEGSFLGINSNLHAACDVAEGRVMNSLEFLVGYGCRVKYLETILGEDNRKGIDRAFIGDEKCYLLMAPVSASKSFEKTDTDSWHG